MGRCIAELSFRRSEIHHSNAFKEIRSQLKALMILVAHSIRMFSPHCGEHFVRTNTNGWFSLRTSQCNGECSLCEIIQAGGSQCNGECREWLYCGVPASHCCDQRSSRAYLIKVVWKRPLSLSKLLRNSSLHPFRGFVKHNHALAGWAVADFAASEASSSAFLSLTLARCWIIISSDDIFTHPSSLT